MKIKDKLLELEDLLNSKEMLLHNYTRKSLSGVGDDINALIDDHFHFDYEDEDDEKTFHIMSEILWHRFYGDKYSIDNLIETY